MNRYFCSKAGFNGKPQRGFTLIELMIGLVILAVLLGLGAPSFNKLLANQRLRAITTDLRLALNTTRSEAVKRNRTVVLSPATGGWNNGWTVADPDDPNDPNLFNHAQRGGVTITGPANVAFNSFGRTSAMEFEVDIDNVSGAAMCLQLQLDGRAVAADGECPTP